MSAYGDDYSDGECVSAAQQRDMDLAAGFKHYDRDSDGFITPEDIKARVTVIWCEPSAAAIQKFMDQLDLDKDGKISKDEWKAVQSYSMLTNDVPILPLPDSIFDDNGSFVSIHAEQRPATIDEDAECLQVSAVGPSKYLARAMANGNVSGLSTTDNDDDYYQDDEYDQCLFGSNAVASGYGAEVKSLNAIWKKVDKLSAAEKKAGKKGRKRKKKKGKKGRRRKKSMLSSKSGSSLKPTTKKRRKSVRNSIKSNKSMSGRSVSKSKTKSKSKTTSKSGIKK